jgi:hypothetical protein
MQKIFSKIITKYSENVENYSEGSYLFTPDVSLDDTLREPYMDRLGVQRGYYIGVNAKKVNFNWSHDWSKTKISPKAKIEEIIIETPNLPENFFEIPITPNWMKFKFIKINNLEPFKRIITESIAFEKCKINSQAIDDLMKFNDALKRIQFTACEIKDIDLSKFKHLKEIQFIYSLDTNQLQQALKGVNFDKLVISLTPVFIEKLRVLLHSINETYRGQILRHHEEWHQYRRHFPIQRPCQSLLRNDLGDVCVFTLL